MTIFYPIDDFLKPYPSKIKDELKKNSVSGVDCFYFLCKGFYKKAVT
jgi:hypothetical protein